MPGRRRPLVKNDGSPRRPRAASSIAGEISAPITTPEGPTTGLPPLRAIREIESNSHLGEKPNGSEERKGLIHRLHMTLRTTRRLSVCATDCRIGCLLLLTLPEKDQLPRPLISDGVS